MSKNFTELSAKDMNEVNGGSVASTLAKVAQTAAKVIIYSTVPSYICLMVSSAIGAVAENVSFSL